MKIRFFTDVSILNSNLMLIGRQIYTDFGKYIELLVIDGSGSIIVIEQKSHKIPRDVVAQVIDCVAWIERLPSEKISQIYKDFSDKYSLPEKSFDKAFEDSMVLLLSSNKVSY